MTRGHIRERPGATSTGFEIRVRANNRTITRTVRSRDNTKTAIREARRQAERLRTQLLAEIDQGEHAGQPGTLTDLVQRWLTATSSGWSPKTKTLYEDYARLHLLPHLGHMQVTQLRAHDLDALYATLSKRLSPSSVRKVHNLTRGALDQAVKWSWVTRNVAADATPPKIRNEELAVPTAEQVRHLMTVAERTDPDFACMLRFLADTGCRRGELVGLRWDDVDLEQAEVVISRAIVHDRRGLVEKRTKTNRARRVALSAATANALGVHRRRWVERSLAIGFPMPAHVFASTSTRRFGQVTRPESVTQHFIRLRERAGIEGVRLHSLRHWAISTAMTAGVDQRTIMGRSGHASLASLGRYAHFSPAADREAARKLGEALDG